MQPPKIPSLIQLRGTTEGGAEPIQLRARGNSQALSDDDRADMLQRLDAGGRMALTVDATVYRQSTTQRPLPASRMKEANSQFVFIRPAELESVAETFGARPVLTDHNESVAAKIGSVATSLAKKRGKFIEFRQELTVTKRAGVEGFLDGTSEEFSVGLERGEKAEMLCSVCGLSVVSFDCSHYPGQVLKLDDTGKRVIVEAELVGFQGRETSAVVFGAVKNTSVDSIAELSDLKKNHKDKTMKTIEELTAEVSALKTQLSQKSAELDAEKEVITNLRTRAETAEASLAEVKATGAAVLIEALEAQALSGAGFGGALFAKNDKRHKFFLAQCNSAGIEAGRAYLTTLEPGVVGAAMQSEGTEVKGTEADKGKKLADDPDIAALIAKLSPSEKRNCELMGIDLADHVRNNRDRI